MKKDTKQLTSKQRKELNKNGNIPARQTIKNDSAETQAQAENAVATEAAPDKAALKKKRRIALIVFSVFLAAVLVVVGIVLPLFFEPYGDYENTVAVFTLSNGEKLEYEIYEKDCPIAATNFIYLAKKGYFDGAIVYDIQEGFVRFGGYRDENYSHISKNENFLSKLTDITLPSNTYSGQNKLCYRLSTDSSAKSNEVKVPGHLSYVTGSSGEFQFCTESDGSLELQNENSTSRKTISAKSFGRYLNAETLEKLKKIYSDNEDKVNKKPGTQNYYWLPLVEIKIQKVEIYNTDVAKWRNFNFDEFLSSNLSYWASSAY